METTFRLKASELNNKFISVIKDLFKEKEIEVTISEAEDETSYLLKGPKNKRRMLKAIENINKNKNLVSFTGGEFDQLSKDLLNK